MPVTVTLRGKEHTLGELSYGRTRRLAPLIDKLGRAERERQAAIQAGDTDHLFELQMACADASVAILVAWAFRPPLHASPDEARAFYDEKLAELQDEDTGLTQEEIAEVGAAIMRASRGPGLVPEGERGGGGAKRTSRTSPLKSVSTGSSPNSSRRASKAARGTR